jgi:benzoate 4-monooxygenase
MDSYALHASTTSTSTALPIQTYQTMSLPAVQIINDRGDFSASLGVLPPWWRPLVKKYIPWYRNGAGAANNLAGIAVVAIAKRLSMDKEMGLSGEGGRVDLLSKLREGKDDEGKPMGREELTAEALTQLIAGSDTTSNSSCAITYYLAHNPEVQQKLQAELDANLGTEDLLVSTNDQVKHLPYLEAVINEALRIHSTSAIGLPRIVPAGGMTIEGTEYKEGAVLSVPSFTIHRDTEVWGDDVETFRPERWFERDKEAIAKTFNPYSYGPR